MPADLNELLQKRCPDTVCAKCRKPFQLGDRIIHAFILVSTDARNPQRVTEKGLELGTDCEFVHIECTDPQLDGKYAAKFRTMVTLT
jgi:hypothetical protein